VGEALNGKDALDRIIETAPDIVITDLNMPVMDGIELIRRLKQTGFKGEIIVLSNYNEFQMVKDAMKAGAADYVLKVTLNGDELVQLIRSLASVTERGMSSGERNRKKNLVMEWMQGVVDEEEVRSLIETFKLRIGERNRLVIASVLRGEGQAPDDESIRNILAEVANRRMATEALAMGSGRCLLVIPTGDSPVDVNEQEAVIRELCEDLRLLIKRYLNIDIQ